MLPLLRRKNITRSSFWDPHKKLDASFRSNELQSEAGELGNIVKKLERERLGLKGSRASMEDLRKEMADVLICLDLLAMHYGIDLEDAVREKFNETSLAQGFDVFL